MSAAYHALEDRIDQAIDALYHGHYTNCAVAARAFDIHPRTLERRWNGGDSKTTRPSAGKALTDEQEQAIKDYIHRLDGINQCARPKMIVGAANFLIRFENRTVGQLWFNRFLKRNPEFHVRKQKPLAAERKDSHDLEDMTEYFNKLERVMKEKGIIEVDVWNMDETGFRIGCGRAQMIITLDPKRPLRMMDPDNRDYITSVECVSSAEEFIPPMLIISGVNILHKWCEENDLDGNILIEISETGYSNDDLALDWLHHFIHHTKRRRNGGYILLIIDGFGSHATISFFELATANNIVLFRLSAHSTHFTQPLDVGVFQPYKHYHTEAIDHAVRMGDREFGKLEFLAAYQSFRNQTFKSSIIRHAFKKTGIVFFNSNMVLDIIRQRIAKNAHTFRTPSPQPQLVERTPKGPESIRKFEEKITRALKDVGSNEGAITMTKKSVDRFQRYVRGIMVAANTLDLTIQDLITMQQASMKRKTRAGLADTVAAKEGVMKVSQCRELCSIRKKKEEEKLKRKAEREAKKVSQNTLPNGLATIAYLIGRDPPPEELVF